MDHRTHANMWDGVDVCLPGIDCNEPVETIQPQRKLKFSVLSKSELRGEMRRNYETGGISIPQTYEINDAHLYLTKQHQAVAP